jgi:hypothetical protein
MRPAETPRRPVVEVAINGKAAGQRPSVFRLTTQAGLHSAQSRLLYPADAAAGKTGEAVTVSLSSDDQHDLYFSGVIYSAATHGKYRELLLTDSYKKLCETNFTAAYRKEKASFILQDILDAAGIAETAITCPDVEVARFSTRSIPARLCLAHLIDTLDRYGVEGLTYFFDEKDVFHFGTARDTGRHEGAAEHFKTGKNIVSSGSGWIEVLPRPIRHTRTVTVNGKQVITTRTDLLLSRQATRLVLYIREEC